MQDDLGKHKVLAIWVVLGFNTFVLLGSVTGKRYDVALPHVASVEV